MNVINSIVGLGDGLQHAAAGIKTALLGVFPNAAKAECRTSRELADMTVLMPVRHSPFAICPIGGMASNG
jgi:hypothetical protein